MPLPATTKRRAGYKVRKKEKPIRLWWFSKSESESYHRLNPKTEAREHPKTYKLQTLVTVAAGTTETKITGTGKDNKKVSAPSEDITAKVVGDFGRWQLWISILMSLLKLSGAWYQLNIIFMAPPQDFWCAKPPNFRYSEEEWRKICAPTLEEVPCLIFDPDILNISPNIDRRVIPLIPCTKFVYDTSVFRRTMVADWNLVCDRHWLVHITQCVMMTGVFIGGIIFGVFADKYGRKNPLMIAIVLQAAASFVAGLMPGYWIFLVTWFILATACGGITIISFVLCMESVSGKWRTIIPVIYQLPFGLGNTVMAVLAYYLRDWRKLEFALAGLSSLYIFYWLWIPESPRWLIADGQTEEAVDELHRAAKMNKRNWTKEQIRALMPKPKKNSTKIEPPAFMDYLKYPGMRLKTMLLSLNWLLTGIAFYTFSQYLGGIGGNIFITVAVTGALSTPGPIIGIFIVAACGRKTSIWFFQAMTATCFVIMIIMPKTYGNDWPRITVAGVGFAAMAASVPTLYLYSGEIYPTLGRNKGLGGVTLFARVGSMMAPFIVTLESVKEDLPLIFLAITSFAQMLLLVPLPETKNQPLPDTIEEAENFVRKPSKNGQEDAETEARFQPRKQYYYW
ncbi:sugar transporter domain-containing protein [Phthorimaea operculella]|nr:sugar transporter domain-containing protein [Phthorimaea operculella]